MISGGNSGRGEREELLIREWGGWNSPKHTIFVNEILNDTFKNSFCSMVFAF